MPAVTRNIGLSLGADICWPLAFEQILADSKLELQIGKDAITFACERVALEPFRLQQGCKYDVVVDRLTHWFALQREWIKKCVLMDGLYVFNNPWTVQSWEKHSTYCAMLALGMPIPATACCTWSRCRSLFSYAARSCASSSLRLTPCQPPPSYGFVNSG